MLRTINILNKSQMKASEKKIARLTLLDVRLISKCVIAVSIGRHARESLLGPSCFCSRMRSEIVPAQFTIIDMLQVVLLP